MNRRAFLLKSVGAATIATLGGSTAANAANSSFSYYAAIQVTNIHCKFCARRIDKSLSAVSGVGDVRIDIGKNVIYVIPAQRQAPSAKAMWQAVETAGFKLVSLSTPRGVYREKPQS